MICSKCDRTILDWGMESFHLIVEEMKGPDEARIVCNDCFNG